MNIIICGYSKENEYKEVKGYSFPEDATEISICKIMKSKLKSEGIYIVTKIVTLEDCKVIYEV